MTNPSRVAIHQPHYFPWLGYFDKMAKADLFIILDQVQFEKGSAMNRNRILDGNGQIQYLTITADTKGFLDKEYRDIAVKDTDKWIARQKNLLAASYRKAPHHVEMLDILEGFFEDRHDTLCGWTCASIELIRNLLGIHTPLCYQSQISYDRDQRRSDLVLALCKASGAAYYFSGRGASVAYLDRDHFRDERVGIIFQEYEHPVYAQCSTTEFVKGLSVLDMLMNCGVEETKRVFWQQVNQGSEQPEEIY